jgi:serine/threonine protein kinase
MRVTNGIPLGCPLLLPVGTVNCVETLKVKLCDFGVSRTMGTYQTKVMTFVGTVRYMAPERLTGQPYSDASDLWFGARVSTEIYT